MAGNVKAAEVIYFNEKSSRSNFCDNWFGDITDAVYAGVDFAFDWPRDVVWR